MVHRSWAWEAHVADLGQFLKCPEIAADVPLARIGALAFVQ